MGRGQLKCLPRCSVILETDPTVVVQRIAIKVEDGSFSEQSMVQVGVPSTCHTHITLHSITGITVCQRKLEMVFVKIDNWIKLY